MRFIRILVFFLLLPLSAEEGGAGRVWTREDGAEFYGRLHGVIRDEASEKAVIADKGGRTYRVETQALSTKDQAFLKKEGWEYPKPWLGWSTNLLVTLAETQVETLAKEGPYFRYRSKNFLLKSEVEIAPPLLSKVARTLEGVSLLLNSSPWGTSMERGAPQDLHDILIFADQENYIKHGGVVGSAACYVSHRKVVMLPYSSLLDLNDNNSYNDNYLAHEVTHLLMTEMLNYLPIWFIEGSAEYMELIEMRTSMFRPRSIKQRLMAHHRHMIKKVRGGRPVSLQQVFALSQHKWRRLHRPGGRRAAQLASHYHAALLLTYYFMHLDGQGKAERLARFTNAAMTNRSSLFELSEEMEANEEQWDKFLNQPEVRQDIEAGYYARPPHIAPPDSFVMPAFTKAVNDKRFLENAVLLDGRTEAQLLQEAVISLKKEGFEVH